MIRSILPASGALALSFLSACDGVSGDPADVTRPSITNLGLATAAGQLAGDEELWLFAARELDSGGRDLNLDGDTLDRVVYVQDLATGRALGTSLALDTRGAFPVLRARDDMALFAVSEAGSGGRDMNADGDEDDAVLHVVDSATLTVRNLGLALAPGTEPDLGDGLVAFLVSETAQGSDLDGDGARTGAVLHVYDAALRATTNTGLALGNTPLFAGGGRFGFFAAESSTDLNGDGDTLDRAVFQVFDPATGVRTSSGLATAGFPPLPAGDAWLLIVADSEQGGLDLDGDGDATGFQTHVFDARTGLVRNLGLGVPVPGGAIVSRSPAAERFGLLVPETIGDLNGDGDLADQVAFLYDPATSSLTGSRRAAVRIVFVSAQLALLVPEAAQGGATGATTDLNGDGDTRDAVAFLLAPASGQTTNLGVDAIDLAGSDALLLLARAESAAGVDWNVDGDRDDVVVHAFDPTTRRTTSTGIASVDVFGATRTEVLLYVDESDQRADLNGDGDRSDQVFVLHDLTKRRNASLGLAGGFGGARFASLTRAGSVVLLANELAQGLDLNRDGDLFDDVFHRAE